MHPVAEDPEVRVVVQRRLGGLGFTVTTSADGRAAPTELAHLGPAVGLLITDLTMPVHCSPGSGEQDDGSWRRPCPRASTSGSHAS